MKARCSACLTTWRFPDTTPDEKLVCPECRSRLQRHSLTASTHHGEVRREVAAEIAGYRILSRIARGATGVVYRARAVDGREIALKVLKLSAQPDPESVARFERESRATMRFDHPNIVKVLDAGVAGARHFIAMEYVEGASLRELFAQPHFPLRTTVQYLRDIARALDHAHGRGVVHRDLKPENILVTADGVPKLSDFGIAKLDGSNAQRMTTAGVALGTPEYMSPEQAAGRSHEADFRSDLYSLGVILYEGASRRLPFKARSAAETLDLIVKKPAPPLKTPVKGVDARLESIIFQSLEKVPELRYASASALAIDLDRWLKGETVSAPSRSVWKGLLARVLPRRKR